MPSSGQKWNNLATSERRSHQHPALREAFLWLTTNPSTSKLEPLILDEISASKETGIEKGRWEENWDWLVSAQQTPRQGGESWEEMIHSTDLTSKWQ